MTTPSHDELIDGFLRGDAASVRLVKTWIDATVSYLTRRSGVDRDDLASESYLALHDSLKRGLYRGQGLRTYVQIICTHKFLDRLRELRRVPDKDPSAVAELASDSLSADQAALRIIHSSRLTEALGQLNEKDRLAVLLWARKTDYDAIAARLGSSYGAARKRVCVAIQRLQVLMHKKDKQSRNK